MKKITLSYIISFITIASFAQNNVGIGTASPNASAILDLSSSTKGLLIPRMATAQRTGIATPATGLLVFDTDTKTIWTYDGAAWKNLYASGSGGTFALPYTGSDASGTSFQITNTLAAGTAIAGKANGSGANNIGVYGESSSGTAVKGYAGEAGSIAVFGSSLSGTAVKAYSFTGTALDVIGNIKISGGNTNPTSGAVLTSDANGNAVWKSQKIAFTAKKENNQALPYSSGFTRLIFDNANDVGNGFHSNGSAFDPNVFVAPVSGFYYFSASAHLRITSATTNIFDATIFITTVGSSSNALIYGIANQSIDAPGWSTAFVQAQGTVHLSAGQKIEVLAFANNTGSLSSVSLGNQFSGFLVFAD
jgi:hypothetical protein